METVESVFQGPMLYLLIAWGVVTAVFIVLVAWRGVLASHEDDQIFLDKARSIGSSANWSPRLISSPSPS